jgi:hypothetical protein
MTCHDVRPLIAAYVDGEVGGAVRLRVEGHLSECPECRQEDDDLRVLGDLLRTSVSRVPVPHDHLAGLAGGVVSRIGAEEAQSIGARWSRMCEDWHWLAIGSGACGAALTLTVFVFTILYSPTIQARQMNEKVGTLYLMAVPEDGRGKPVVLEYGESMGMPKGDHRYSMPASFGWKAEQALAAALDKSLMRHGETVNFVDLSAEAREEVTNLLNEISRLRQAAPTRRPNGLTQVSGMHLFVNEVVTAAGI